MSGQPDDGLGSTRALTDETGTVTDTYDYTVYGEMAAQAGSTLNNYLYAGEQLDEETGNYYLRARYYDQSIGRFTQQDTWEGKQFSPITLNKYTYGNSDPVNWTDPSGHFGLSSIGAALRINGILTSSATTVGRSVLMRAMTGRAGKETFGIVGEEIIALAQQSLLKVLIEEAAGRDFPNAGSKGTAAHLEFERLIKNLNGKYKKYGLRIAAEVFRDGGSGGKVKRRAKGSVGIDVAILSTRTGKTLLAFDLKTGRGASKGRNQRLSAVFDGVAYSGEDEHLFRTNVNT